MQDRPIRVQVPGHGIVEFPAGTSENVMREALQTLSQQPFNAPRLVMGGRTVSERPGVPERQMSAIAARQGGMTPERREQSIATGREMAVPAAGAIGAAMSGGLTIPAMMAGAAQIASDADQDIDPVERKIRALWAGVEQSGLGLAGKVASVAAPWLKNTARSLWNRGAKITMPTARSTSTMRTGGSLEQAKDEIAETVLSQGRGTIRRGNARAVRETIGELEDALDEVVAGADGFVRREELRDALRAAARDVGPASTQAAALQLDALERSFNLLKNAPYKMTVAEAQKMKRQIYDTFSKSYPAGAAESATAAAEKVTARALKEGIVREVPEARPINAAMQRQIPAARAMDEAVSRIANHNLVGLSGALAIVSERPAMLAAALLNNPQFASFTAQQIYRVASLLPESQLTASNVLRGLQMLTGATSVPSRAAGPGLNTGGGGS